MPKAIVTGPHDPFNAQSVKLAEATRIRLILPGLGDVEEVTEAKTRNGKTSSEASAKTLKKLSKLKKIANKAEQGQAAVLVDEGLLNDGEEVEQQEQQQQHAHQAAQQRRSQQQQQEQQQEERLRSGLDSSTSRRATPADGRRHTASRGRGNAVESDRLAPPSDSAVARMAAAKRIPIWERLSNPYSGQKEKPPMPQKATLTAIQLKTFSPTLGSFATVGTLLPDSLSPKSPGDTRSPATEGSKHGAGGAPARTSGSLLSPPGRPGKLPMVAGQPLLSTGIAHLQGLGMQHAPGSATALLEQLTLGSRGDGCR